jgi:hypothetical protein
MAFEVQLILFEPRDIELLAGGTAFKLPSDVFLVVADNPVIIISIRPSEVQKTEGSHLVIIPVVLTPSVLCVTRNFPASLIGL